MWRSTAQAGAVDTRWIPLDHPCRAPRGGACRNGEGIRSRLETVWKEAERRTCLFGGAIDMCRDPELEISRNTGAKIRFLKGAN
jgi:hypothetical protein